MCTEPSTSAHGAVPSMAEELEVRDKTPNFPNTGKVSTGPTGSEGSEGDKRKHRQRTAEMYQRSCLQHSTNGHVEAGAAGHTVPIKPTAKPLAKKSETEKEGHCDSCQ